MIYVAMYLAAVVLANLTVSWWGPNMTIINAFLFVGLDLTSRDKLHDAWHGNGLLWKMAALIAAGSFLSWLIDSGVQQIAIASFISFSLAAVVDTVVYHLLRRRSWSVRVNGSNLFSAAVDSVVFPTLAFGMFMPWIVLGQFAAKVAGGAMWSVILRRKLSPVITPGIEAIEGD